MANKDMSCARVKQYKASNIGASERHNERKNDTYSNLNVVPERMQYNVHFKDPGEKTYMDILEELERNRKVSRRGLRPDATLFDEIVLDVNTMYFDRNGGYEYAKRFYEEAYHFLERKFGSEYILSAVMHADELNKAATDELGVPTYHYHMHAVVIPVVEKEIRWSKRCKDPELRGTVKEVIHQISHSKKWASTEPILDDHGTPVLRANGKPKFRASYSILQDEFVDHMREAGYRDFQRGELGSTAEHLSSLQYQIEKDKERLTEITSETEKKGREYFMWQDDIKDKKAEYESLQRDFEKEKAAYTSVAEINKTKAEVEAMGKKTLTGKISLTPEEYSDLKSLAVSGANSKSQINDLTLRIYEAENDASYYCSKYFEASSAFYKLQERFNQLQERFDQLVERCKPFIEALEHFPNIARWLINKVHELSYERVAEKKTTHKKEYEHKPRHHVHEVER